MTKVIMHGCNGKMGQVITGLIAQDEDVKIVAGIDTYDEKKMIIRYIRPSGNARLQQML